MGSGEWGVGKAVFPHPLLPVPHSPLPTHLLFFFFCFFLREPTPVSLRTTFPFRPPNIPSPLISCPIIIFISTYCLSNLSTSLTLWPLPSAMRRRRDALIIM